MKVALILLLLIGFALPASAALPSFAQVQADYPSSESWLLDRHGETMQTLRLDPGRRRLPWVKLDAISPALKQAVLLSEDRHFEAHRGVDWSAMLEAAWGNATGRKVRGASTITMQVAGLLDSRLMPGDGRRSLTQKWEQLARARELEAVWSKSEIFEAYLNLVSFRGELQGVGAASQILFGKTPAGLNRYESLLLAALIRGPNASATVVAKRACGLAAALNADNDCDTLRALAPGILARKAGIAADADAAPQLAQQLLQAPGHSLRSSLDAGLQRYAQEALRTQVLALREQNVQDGALLVLDNASGEVLAYVANLGDAASARHVDGVRALRQAGSTLKPFLYELALERRLLTAASLLDDTPVNLVTPTGLYVPQNYDNDFKGPVSVRSALASSLNVPAVRTLMLTGLERFRQRLVDVGLSSLTESGDFYGYSLALGSAEVSLLDLANAYRVLANQGAYSPLRFTPDAARPAMRQVMGREAAFVVADILSDREARSLTFGLENPLATRYWTAVKTGTSKGMRDNWCVGFSRRYTVAVWVGNFDGESMWQVSGITGAAPVWLAVMNRLHEGAPDHAPPPPARLVRARVRFDDGIETARDEWFLSGTQRPRVTLVKQEERAAHIRYPGSGSVFAYDPDIPPKRQRVLFRADAVAGGLQWRLNDQLLGPAEEVFAWDPRPGEFHLALLDDHGNIVDQVNFEVRGGSAAGFPHAGRD